MSEEDLRQKLRELFKVYPGWKLRTLKQRTRQPEKLLRKVLGEIAFQHTSGDLASVYQLTKDEERAIKAEQAMLTAAHVAPEEPGTDDDDDEDPEVFVDALMQEASEAS